MAERTLTPVISSMARYLSTSDVRVTYYNPEFNERRTIPFTRAGIRDNFSSAGISLPMAYRQLHEIQLMQFAGLLPTGSEIDLSDVSTIKPGRLIATVGGQGGDEGKGKIADALVEQSNMVVRATGGNNARYTFVVNGEEYQLRHLPLGIVDPSKMCVIAPGTFNDPAELIWEIYSLQSRGIEISRDNLRISRQAQAVFPIHRLRGRVEEAHNTRSGKKIASTSKGTGPGASAAAGKRGITFDALLEEYYMHGANPELRLFLESLTTSEAGAIAGTRVLGQEIDSATLNTIKERTYGEELVKLLSVLLIHHDFKKTPKQEAEINALIEESNSEPARKGFDGVWGNIAAKASPLVHQITGRNITMDQMFFDVETNAYLSRINMDILVDYMEANVPRLITSALDDGETVLLQGVQGTLISRTAGVYPYTAGADSVIASLLVGSCMGYPISESYGVIKAYQTLSGGGMMPFPTEILPGGDLSTDQLNTIRKLGGEFGVTIGGRRIGWMDIPMLKYSAMVNGLTSWGLTHLDAFMGIEEIKLCVDYEYEREGKTVSLGIDKYNPNPRFLERVNPVYITTPGWKEDISGARRFEDLPLNAQLYLKKVAELTGVPISITSIGAAREQTIFQMIFPSGNIGQPWQ